MAVRSGTRFQDTLRGSSGADTLSGRGGGDTLNAGDGNDIVYGHGSGDATLNPGPINAIRIATGLDRPVFAESPPGDNDHLYVIEQRTGKVQIVDIHTGEIAATPFLDIPNTELSVAGEGGLIGFTFSPDYQTSGKFYVYVTNELGDTEVREYTRSASDPDVADLASERLIITYDQPDGRTNHKAGWIGFGPDGYLYIASGDGGGAGDPDNRAQDLSVLLGKVLRIDVNGDDFAGDDSRNYAIPDDNPFVGVAGAAEEIWHYGLRNPFRMSFDSETGDMFIADVGQRTREELNYVPAGVGGLNFGWRIREGSQEGTGPDDPSFTDPVLDYPRDGTPYSGRAIIGGYVYHGPGGGQGLYFFADSAEGHLFTTRIVDGVAQDFANRDDQIIEDVGTIGNVTSFAEGADGSLYVMDLQGQLYRLDPSASSDDGHDVLGGGRGDDTLYGGTGEDSLNGGTGDDRVYGGSGDDTIAVGKWGAGDPGFGNDLLDGGEGIDTVSFANASAGIVADLDVTTAQGQAGRQLTLVSVENLEGSKFADTIWGDELANLISGGGGADILDGRAGNDTLFGGLGSDSIRGGGGVDVLVYTDVRESRSASADIITAFQSSTDRIDLTAIDADTTIAGNQAFRLVTSFSGQAGQLTVSYDPLAMQTFVRADIDGDGISDFLIRIEGDHTDFSRFYL